MLRVLALAACLWRSALPEFTEDRCAAPEPTVAPDDGSGVHHLFATTIYVADTQLPPAVLAEAGCGYEDIVDSTLYMVDLQKNAGTMFKVKDEFVKEPYPASTWIGITELMIPGARAEVKVTARKPR